MNTKLLHTLLHIAGSLLFLSLPIFFAPGPLSLEQSFHQKTLQEFTSYFLILCVFYLHFYLWLPKFFFNKKFVSYVLIVSLSLILVLVIPRLLFDVHPPHHKHHFPTLPHRPHHGFLNWFELSNDIFPFLLVIFFSLILKINERWRYAENEKTRVQLSFLQAQINPHFLFNTLNSIYSLAIQKSDYTSTAIVKLAGMMRYVLYETKHDFISLQKELDYLSDYIELQKIRLNDTITIDFKIEGSAEGKQIAPLILVPFVENAFKHGVNPEENATIMIHISIKENNLELSVKNKKVTNNSLTNTEAGLGIENTETRLQLLYPGRYQLSIQDLNDEFFVYLALNFQ